MAQTTNRFLDYNGLVKYTSIVKGALADKVDSTTLATGTSGSEGAGLVGYHDGTSATTVEATLDSILSTIGGSSGSSLSTRVTNLENGTNLIQGTNITLTKDTTNHTVTIAATDTDEKVAQTAKSDNVEYPVLLASGASPATGGANYGVCLKYNPKAGEEKLIIGTSATTNVGKLELSNGVVTFKDNAVSNPSDGTIDITHYTGSSDKVKQTASSTNAAYPVLFSGGTSPTSGNGGESVSYDGDMTYNPSTNTLVVTNVTGTASRATADASGNNIATTYATKAEILLPEPEIVQSLPTSQSDIAALKGKFVFVLDSGASTDTKNVYTEYIVVGEESGGTTTYKFERIGSTEVNLDIDALTDNEIETIWTTTTAVA